MKLAALLPLLKNKNIGLGRGDRQSSSLSEVHPFPMTSSLPSLSPPNPLSYGRLRPSLSSGLPDPDSSSRSALRNRRALLALSAIFLVAACSALGAAIVKSRQSTGTNGLPVGASQAIALACGQTQYPELCEESLAEFPGALDAKVQGDLVPISMNVSLGRVGHALMASNGIGNWEMGSYDRSAYGDCLQLLDDSIDLLNRSMAAVSAAAASSDDQLLQSGTNKLVGGTTADVMTWLTAALTNQDTCAEGLSMASEAIKAQMSVHLQNVSQLVSNSLDIYATTYAGGDIVGEPNNNNRRLMSSFSEEIPASGDYPSWVSRADRNLLEFTPAENFQADVVVSKNGESGTVRTIREAISKAPERSQRRFVIYIKAGRYEESKLEIGKQQSNVWLIGDGMGQTVITGTKSVDISKISTFDTATLGCSGHDFVARDITFTNEAGAENHQAVALRVNADRAVIYRCEMKGYQDTLYAHSRRQFYRECNIYGTVDFIFGNAAVVLQRCKIFVRKPMAHQKCTITAQGRKASNQYSGTVFHECEIRATAELEPVNDASPTYLGRPWRNYARVVYMMSYLGDNIAPEGWLAWTPDGPVDKLFYGEYMNYGPGASTRKRVNWPGVHARISKRMADRFTVGRFLKGAIWLTQTGVAFQAGLAS